MSIVARLCKVVSDKEKGGFCPAAGCIPGEEQVLPFDAARSEFARSQQMVMHHPG